MTILLTGSNGYLGNVLLPLLYKNYSVVPIDLGIFDPENVKNKFMKFDLSSDDLSTLNKYNISTVIHLAGISNDPSCELHPDLTSKMNVLASQRLIEWAKNRKIKKFIFASSASVYGINKEVAKETDTLNPQSDYAASKMFVEDMLNYTPEINPIILRFGTLFGYSNKMRLDIAVNLMTKTAYQDHKITVFGDGEQYRPFLHVTDAANSLLHALKFNGIITTNVLTTNILIKDLATMVGDKLSCKVIFDGLKADNRDYRMSNEKMKSEFGFYPTLSFESGIDDVYRWCAINQDSLNSDVYYTIRMWKKYYKEYLNG